MELEECLNILKCLRAKKVEFNIDDLKCEDEIEYIGEKEWFKGFGDIKPDILIAPKNKADLHKFAEHYRKHGAKNLFPQTYATQKNYTLVVIWSDGKIICLKRIS